MHKQTEIKHLQPAASFKNVPRYESQSRNMTFPIFIGQEMYSLEIYNLSALSLGLIFQS